MSRVKRLLEAGTEQVCECGEGCTLDVRHHERTCPAREYLRDNGASSIVNNEDGFTVIEVLISLVGVSALACACVVLYYVFLALQKYVETA